MHPTLRYGLILGLAVAAWILLFNLLGWHRQPSLYLLRFILVVVAFQVGVLLLALRRTAAENGYGRQVWTGVSLSLVASLVIFGASLLATQVLFPTHLREAAEAGRDLLLQQGRSPQEVDALLQAQAPMRTPVANAMAGVMGTMMTGAFVSLVAGWWWRRK